MRSVTLGLGFGAMLLSIGFACSNGSGPGPGPGSGGSTGSGGLPGVGGAPTGSGGAPTGTGGASPATGGGSSGGAGGSSGGTTGSGGTGGGATGSLVPGTELYDCSPPTGTLPPLVLVPYVSGLNNPIYVTHAPGEVERMFVLEQAGKIRVIKSGVLSEAPFLDISTKVDDEVWEQGLLGLAFHPDYAENGLFYIHYNSLDVVGHDDGAGIISEFKVSSADADVADPASERILLGAPTTNKYHNGGSIFFGPDKLLFIAFGDGAGDTSNPDLFPDADPTDALDRELAQDLTSFRGKMLRINPLLAGVDPYTSPAGNLIAEVPAAAPEVWSYGLRNPYRSNIDPCTGDIYMGDVGDRAWESLDIEPGLTGHYNYGWPIREGNACHKDTVPIDGCTDPDRYRGPFDVHPNTDGGGPPAQASIGGSVYRGSSIPALRGTYFFADLYGPTKTLRYDKATDTLTQAVTSVETQLNPAENDQGIVAIQNGGDGELYFVSRGGSGMGLPPSGVVYKLQAAD